MKKETLEITRFRRDDGLYVDVVPSTITDGFSDFWLGHKDIPIKSLMFVVSNNNIPQSEWGNIVEDIDIYIDTFFKEIKACGYSNMLK